MDELADDLADDGTNDSLPQVLILWHIVALGFMLVGVGIYPYSIVDVWDANAREDCNANRKYHSRLLLFWLSLISGFSSGLFLCHFISFYTIKLLKKLY